MDEPALELSRRDFESQGALSEFLRSAGMPSEMVGTSVVAPSAYYSFEVRQGERRLANIGLVSSGLGIEPSWLMKKSKLLIGFDDRVAVFSVPRINHEREVPLLSVFYAFLDLKEHPHLCVVCETAVIAMLPDGVITWRADTTDVVADYRVLGDVIEMQFMDSKKARIDLTSGKRWPT